MIKTIHRSRTTIMKFSLPQAPVPIFRTTAMAIPPSTILLLVMTVTTSMKVRYIETELSNLQGPLCCQFLLGSVKLNFEARGLWQSSSGSLRIATCGSENPSRVGKSEYTRRTSFESACEALETPQVLRLAFVVPLSACTIIRATFCFPFDASLFAYLHRESKFLTTYLHIRTSPTSEQS